MQTPPTLDFSRCSDEQVAELAIAATEKCGWLCEILNYEKSKCVKCPACSLKSSACTHFNWERITRPEIFEQCLAEIDRRPEPEWIKRLKK